MADLVITRLLQNPLGEPAPQNERGDIVAITDGTATIYLTPEEFAGASHKQLRWLLAQQPLK